MLGSGINSDVSVGETALVVSAKDGTTDVLGLLLDHGADPNLANEFFGFTPLMFAIRGRNLPAVERLLAAGANPNRVSKKGQSTLQIAMDEYTGITKEPIDERIVQRLRERGAH
jgi:ankyrin repeat protein